MNANKGCHNCVHRYGMFRELWMCGRTGWYTEVELRYNGRCAQGLELRLWSPRPTLLGRIINIVRAASGTAANQGEQQ